MVFHDAEVIVCLKRVRREDGLEGGLEALVVLVRADAAGVEVVAQRERELGIGRRADQAHALGGGDLAGRRVRGITRAAPVAHDQEVQGGIGGRGDAAAAAEKD